MNGTSGRSDQRSVRAFSIAGKLSSQACRVGVFRQFAASCSGMITAYCFLAEGNRPTRVFLPDPLELILGDDALFQSLPIEKRRCLGL